jgi:hypothetical protein
MALELLNHIAVGWIAWFHPQQARHLLTGDAHQQVVTIRRIEPQAVRRTGADVAHRTDRGEHMGLNRVEVRRQRAGAARSRLQRLTLLSSPWPFPAHAANSSVAVTDSAVVTANMKSLRLTRRMRGRSLGDWG